jgi:hypothetical protein
MGKATAWVGEDVVRGNDWKPLQKSLNGWQVWANNQAQKLNPKGFWHGVVAWVPCREAYRISFAGQPE